MLTRNTPLRSRPKPAVPAALRELLQARSSGWCEGRLPGCTLEATDPAHRISRKMGGRPAEFHRLSNVLHLCRACHSWCHARPQEARDLGLMLAEHQDPTVEPVAYQNEGWVRLDDDGTLWPVTA